MYINYSKKYTPLTKLCVDSWSLKIYNGHNKDAVFDEKNRHSILCFLGKYYKKYLYFLLMMCHS